MLPKKDVQIQYNMYIRSIGTGLGFDSSNVGEVGN
jgi:hypothetical protein